MRRKFLASRVSTATLGGIELAQAGSVRLIDDMRLPEDGEGEAYVRIPSWWLEIIEELNALYSDQHEAEFRLHKVMNELVGKNMGRDSSTH
jgi:hypothetical protein